MNESSRVTRRARPRPYDLRRKVLLKNFLHEQMTYIPPLRERSETSTNISYDVQIPSTSTDANEPLTDLNDENNTHTLDLSAEPESVPVSLVPETIEVPSISRSDDSETAEHDQVDTVSGISRVSDVEKPRRSKFSRLSSLMRLRKNSKKKRNKGILKAKHMLKSMKNPVKSKSVSSSLEKLFSWPISEPCSSKQADARESSQFSQTVLSLFKPGRSGKKSDKDMCVQKHDSVSSSSTTNQAVQTDVSYPINGSNSIEESYKILREENKLLTQSLSLLLCEASICSSHEPREMNSTLLSHSESESENGVHSELSLMYDKEDSPNILNSSNCHETSQNCRLQRSHSVQEHSERRRVTNTCHRTRSMNSHNAVVGPSLFVQSISSTETGGSHQPRTHRTRSNVLRTLSVNSSGRTLRRRSSMPEQKHSENIRHLATRRSSSVRDYGRRSNSIPFQDLPIQAFY